MDTMNEERMDQERIHYTNKIIEVAPGVKVVHEGSVTVEDDGRESGSHELRLITKHGTQYLDGSPHSVNLQSATVEGNEIVVKWTRQEKCYEEKRRYVEIGYGGCEEEIDRWIEEVTRSRECEKRIPVR